MRIKPSDDALDGAIGLLSPRISRILTDWWEGDSRGDRENRERKGVGGRDAIPMVVFSGELFCHRVFFTTETESTDPTDPPR